jgi:hypothetical protein
MVPPAVIPWPADTKIDIAIDATAASVAGDTIGMPLSGTFTTSAM